MTLTMDHRDFRDLEIPVNNKLVFFKHWNAGSVSHLNRHLSGIGFRVIQIVIRFIGFQLNLATLPSQNLLKECIFVVKPVTRPQSETFTPREYFFTTPRMQRQETAWVKLIRAPYRASIVVYDKRVELVLRMDSRES